MQARLIPVLAAFLSTAAVALAQPPTTQCFTGSIPITPTNWSSSVTVPKFDPNLGTLQSVTVSITANSTGSARAESLDSAPSVVSLTFQNVVAVQRPDNTLLVAASPQVNFLDNLSAYDGVLDFGGTSGVSHLNLAVSATNSVTVPPPAGDLALFTGPGTITLPVAAIGTSSASGAGNLIAQFTSAAGADVQVCYLYLPNTPPFFTTPTCNTQFMASVGVPFSIQVCAADNDAGDVVTLNAVTMPAGAVTVPPTPQSGNPVCVTVNWIPANNQVGVQTFTFVATDSHQRSTTCSFTVLVAECHQILGLSTGSDPFEIFGHIYQTQLSQIRRTFPVTMEDNPPFRMVPNQVLFAQVVMYNPLVFPQNPEQWSRVARIQMNHDDTLYVTWSGNRNGITLRPTTVEVNGETRVHLPFTIDGM
jgi:hypothetical protein